MLRGLQNKAAERKKRLRSEVGTGGRLSGTSLGVFGPKNKFRIKVFRAIYNQAFESLLGLVIVGYLAHLAMKSSAENLDNSFFLYLDVGFNLFFSLEAALRIIALGFYKGPDSYLRNTYNRLDFIVLVTNWVFCVIELGGVREPVRLGSLKGVRAILCFRVFKSVAASAALMEAISTSIPQMVDIFSFAALFFVFFALVGVNFFHGAFRRRCIMPYIDIPAGQEGHYQEMGGGIEMYPPLFCNAGNDRIGDGFQCPAACYDSAPNPNFGYTSFDNIGITLLTIFQTLTLEGWDRLMFNIGEAASRTGTAYFLVFIIIGTYFLVSIFVAAISGVFLRLRKEHQLVTELTKRREGGTLGSSAMAALPTSVAAERRKSFSDQGRQRFMSVVQVAVADKRKSKSPIALLRYLVVVIRLKHSETAMKKTFIGKWRRQRRQGVHPANEGSGLSLDIAETLYPSGAWDKMRIFLLKLTTNKYFTRGTRVLIGLNFLLFALYYHGMDPATEDLFDMAQIFFALAFLIEVIIRALADNPVVYFTDMTSILDFAFTILAVYGTLNGWRLNTAVLRAFWFFMSSDEEVNTNRSANRRTSGSVKTLFSEGSLILQIVSAGSTLFSLFMFFLIVIAVFSILGMMFFGGRFVFNGVRPRQHFDTFPDAFLTMFSVTTGEQWVDVLWDGLRVHWISAPFFILFYILTSYVIANLIIAVILETLELKDAQKKYAQKKEIYQRTKPKRPAAVTLANGLERVRVFFVCMYKRRRFNEQTMSEYSMRLSQELLLSSMSNADPSMREIADPWAKKKKKQSNASTRSQPRRTGNLSSNLRKAASRRMASQVAPEGNFRQKAKRRSSVHQRWSQMGQQGDKTRGSVLIRGTGKHAQRRGIYEVEGNQIVVSDSKAGSGAIDFEIPATIRAMTRRATEMPTPALMFQHPTNYELPGYMSDNPYFLFPLENQVRSWTFSILQQRWYDIVSIFFVFISIVSIFMEEPVGRVNPREDLIFALDALVALYFWVNFFVHTIAQGVLLTPDAYLLDFWNIIDFLLLLLDTASLLDWSDYMEAGVRMLLTLRTLRLISRNSGMRDAAKSLAQTMPAILSIFGMALIIFILFGMLGVRMFGGMYAMCNDPTVTGRLDCVGTFEDERGFLISRAWSPLPYNFDWIGKAVLTLFETATLDEWLDVMYHAMDVKEEFMQPRTNVASVNAIYFVIFIMVGSFFVIRSFVGVFIDQFGVQSGSKLLTEKQKLFKDMYRIIVTLKPKKVYMRPVNFVRRLCYDCVRHRYFDKLAFSLVSLNVVAIGLVHHNMDPNLLDTLDWVNLFFVVFYCAESLMKMAAYGRMWTDKWHVFEAILAFGSLGVLFPSSDIARKWGGAFAILRIFRVTRFSTSLNVFLRTILASIPALVHIVGLLGIVLFIYSGVGVQYFDGVKYGLYVNKKANFERFANSFLVLFHCMTQEGWRNIMNDLKRTLPRCTIIDGVDGTNDCGDPWGAMVFFTSYIALCGYIFTNVFVAAILDYITFGILKEMSMISPIHLQQFQELWSKWERNNSGCMGAHNCMPFAMALGPPLGNKNPKLQWKRDVRYEFRFVRHVDGQVEFQKVLEVLLLHRLGKNGLTYDMAIDREREFENMKILGACLAIQALARGYISRKKTRKKFQMIAPLAMKPELSDT